VDGTTINHAIGGSGAPVLLHSYPRAPSHVALRRLGLTMDHTVVVADLRGYGDSGKRQEARRQTEAR
jgi:haloacetate dehalogenase